MSEITVNMIISGDSSFTRKFGKKVKAAGGEYSHSRGMQIHRAVIGIPASKMDLIRAICEAYAVSRVAAEVVVNGQVCSGISLSNSSWSTFVPANLQIAMEELEGKVRARAARTAHEASLDPTPENNQVALEAERANAEVRRALWAVNGSQVS